MYEDVMADLYWESQYEVPEWEDPWQDESHAIDQYEREYWDDAMAWDSEVLTSAGWGTDEDYGHTFDDPWA